MILMATYNKKSLAELSPNVALEILKNGNQRFVNNISENKNYLQQMSDTSDGQYPFAIVLSCIDSRTSSELIFDLGIGDIFSARVAGNIVNEDILGSMEYAIKYAGSKLIVVLGHTKCGAITSACNHVEDGNITALLNKIQPVLEKEKTIIENRTGSNKEFVDRVTNLNVAYVMSEIIAKSDIIANKINQGEIKLVGGVHDIETGLVHFFED
jgi:carbonic anhydrase